jgi:two-component system response regulator
MLEYDPDDRYISKEFFAQAEKKIGIDFVTNSDEFFAFLHMQRYSEIPLPSLIIMNQKASPADPLTLLKQLKTDPYYKAIPVVVLGDISHAGLTRSYYEAGAASFILKPVTYDDTRTKIDTFIRYWFQTVALNS